MEPEIVAREGFTVMGAAGHFPSAAADFGPLWMKYMEFGSDLDPQRTSEGSYGVYLGSDHSAPIGYLAGVHVNDAADAPEGAETCVVPWAIYAVFRCELDTLGATYGHVWNEWLPASKYRLDTDGLGFDFFPPGTASGASPVEAWVPIRPADEE